MILTDVKLSEDKKSIQLTLMSYDVDKVKRNFEMLGEYVGIDVAEIKYNPVPIERDWRYK